MSAIAPASPESSPVESFCNMLDAQQVASSRRCLLIVDVAQLNEGDVFRNLYHLCEDPKWVWLFEDSPLASHAEAGPIVVETVIDSDFSSHALSQWSGRGLVFILTHQPMGEALAGIRKMLFINLETSGPCLMRPYDTRFLQLFSVCLPQQAVSLAGADATWIWCIDVPDGIEWSVLRRDAVPVTVKTHQSKAFERLLSWVTGWPRYNHLIATPQPVNAKALTDFVAQQWRTGVACPDDVSALTEDWHRFVSSSAKSVRQTPLEDRVP